MTTLARKRLCHRTEEMMKRSIELYTRCKEETFMNSLGDTARSMHKRTKSNAVETTVPSINVCNFVRHDCRRLIILFFVQLLQLHLCIATLVDLL